MNPSNRVLLILAAPVLLIAAVTVFPRDDGELADFARTAMEQQHELIESINSQHEHLATAAEQLVLQDSTARKELLTEHARLQLQIEAERANIDRLRGDLVDEQRHLAAARHRDPIIAHTLQTLGTTLIVTLPLLVCAIVVRSAHSAEPEQLLNELLICEVAGHNTMLGWQPKHLPLQDDPLDTATAAGHIHQHTEPEGI